MVKSIPECPTIIELSVACEQEDCDSDKFLDVTSPLDGEFKATIIKDKVPGDIGLYDISI